MGELENRLIASATPKFFKGVSDLVAKELVVYWWLKKNGRMVFNTSGRGAEWRVRLRRGAPIGYSGIESINFAARNDREVASLAYRGIADGFMLTWQEVEMCKGEEAIYNLMDESAGDLDADLLDALGTDIYLDGTTRGGKTIHGFGAFLATTGTYANLSQTNNANWRAQVISGAGFTSDPVGRLHRLKNATSKGEKGGKSRSRISIYLMPDVEFEALSAKLEAQRRFHTNPEMAEAGFDNCTIHGVVAAKDEYCPDSTVIGLNHRTVELRHTTSKTFETFSGWTEALPRVYTGVGVSHMNLYCFNPRANGKLTATNT